MKLSDAIVATLELPAGKTEHFIWDDALPAFGVRLRGGTGAGTSSTESADSSAGKA